MHTVETLENGLRLVVARASGTEAASILVLVKVGSRYETKEISGAAHFIEHMMFKGTKHHPTSRDLSRTLEQFGADYNAYTTKEQTGYYVKIAGVKLGVGIELLHDMLAHSKFSPVEMKRERGVILEEINMYKDNPRMHLADLLDSAIYGDTPLGWDTAGDERSMREMTRNQVLNFHESYYVPSRMVVVLAGAVQDEHIALAKKLFNSFNARSSGAESTQAPAFIPRSQPAVAFQNKDTGQVQLAIGFPGKSITSHEMPALRFLTSILGGGMSSRLFISVRERKGLAYSVGMSCSSFIDSGFCAISAGLAKKQYGKAVETIIDEIRKIKRSGPTKNELNEAKTRVEGQVLLSLEDCAERAEWYANQILFKGEAKDPAERLKDFMQVSREEVMHVAREVLDESRMSIAAIGPFESETAILKPFLSP